jgi:hypothetical protein
MKGMWAVHIWSPLSPLKTIIWSTTTLHVLKRFVIIFNPWLIVDPLGPIAFLLFIWCDHLTFIQKGNRSTKGKDISPRSFVTNYMSIEKSIKWPWFWILISPPPLTPISTWNLVIHKMMEFCWIKGDIIIINCFLPLCITIFNAQDSK